MTCGRTCRTGVTDHLESNGILSDSQHGFRKRRSCETQLILTVDDLANVIDKGGQTDTILLDFSTSRRLSTKSRTRGSL
jgi:hypothetical protein